MITHCQLGTMKLVLILVPRIVRWIFRAFFRSGFSKGILFGALIIFFYSNTKRQVLDNQIHDSVLYKNTSSSIRITTTSVAMNFKVTVPEKVIKQVETPTNGLKSDWVEVEGSKRGVFIYSAFYDTRRQPSVIIVAIIRKKFQITECQVWTKEGKSRQFPATIKLIRENWGLQYTAGFVICNVTNLPKDDVPTMVAIKLSNVTSFKPKMNVINSDKRDWEGSFSVCVKPFHYNFNRVVWLAEFIELHRILGVEKFFFYNHTVGTDLEETLQYYIRENIVEMYPWSLPVKSQKEIRTEGIFAALNDCNLRNVGRFHHTIMIDIDEFIIPRKHDNYSALISSLGDNGAYIFQNVFFYLYWENDTVTTTKLYGSPEALGTQLFGTESEGPYLLTAYKTTRLSKPHRHGQRSKYIVKSEKAFECGNHAIWEFTGGKRLSKMVKADVALVHHYRICEYGGFECLNKQHQTDRTTHKWLPALIKSVAEVCSNVFPSTGTCPEAPPLGSPW